MENLPKGNPYIQQADACYRSAHPAGSNNGLQPIQASLARRVQKKIVIAPIAQAQRALRNPRQEREHNTYFKAEDNIENDT